MGRPTMRTLFRLAAVTATLLLGSPIGEPHAFAIQEPCGTDAAVALELAAKAHARVIVALRDVAMVGHGPAAAGKAAVRRSQDALLRRLPAGAFAVRRRFGRL